MGTITGFSVWAADSGETVMLPDFDRSSGGLTIGDGAGSPGFDCSELVQWAGTHTSAAHVAISLGDGRTIEAPVALSVDLLLF